LFTNDQENLLIFENNGSLFLNQTGLSSNPWTQASTGGVLWVPATASKIGDSKLYAKFNGLKAYTYSLKNGVMKSSELVPYSSKMKFAFGKQDLLINFGLDTFEIKDILTNATLYTSIQSYYNLMASTNYYFAEGYRVLYVFDRHTPGKLLQTITLPQYSYPDTATNQILGLSPGDADCQITYLDLETLAVSNGPLIKNKDACSFGVIHINITDKANPFFIVQKLDKYLFVSPTTYGTVSWTFDYDSWAEGVMVPVDAGASFSFVFTSKSDSNKEMHYASYKLNKLLKKFTLEESFLLTVLRTTSSSFGLYPLIDNKILMAYQDKKIAIFDLTQKNYVTYDVPAFYDSIDGVGIFYDKNKTPYLALSEIVPFGQVSSLPQLFDFAKITPMPGMISNLTRSAIVTGPCHYYALDEFSNNIGIVRFYDTCNENSTKEKISI